MLLRKKPNQYQVRAERKKKLRLAIIGCLILGGTVWAGSLLLGGPGKITATPEEAKAALREGNVAELQALPPEERKARLNAYGKALSTDILARRGDDNGDRQNRGGDPAIRAVMEKLSPEDRDAFRNGMSENFRKQREKEQDAKILTFFKATPEEQAKLLQEEIARQKQREEEWKKRSENNGTGSTGTPGANTGNNNRPRNNWANTPREKREERMRDRLNSTSPEMRALQSEYFNRLRAASEAAKK